MKFQSDQETNDLHSLAQGKEGRQELNSEEEECVFLAARDHWPDL